MPEAVTQTPESQVQDNAAEMDAMEAALTAEATGRSQPEAKEKAKPSDNPTERGDDGKFKAKEPKDEDAPEEGDVEAEATEADDDEADPFEEKPQAKPHQLDKGLQKLQQDMAAERRELKKELDDLRRELREAREAKAKPPATDKAAKLKKLVDEGHITEEVAAVLAEESAPATDSQPEVDRLRNEMATLREERAWDRKFNGSHLVGKYEQACDLARQYVRDRYPNLPETDPRFAALAYDRAYSIGEQSMKLAAKKAKGKAKAPVTDDASDPAPSTKAARIATNGVSRAPQDKTAKTEREEYEEMERTLKSEIGRY